MSGIQQPQETTQFWRHPRFRDLGMLKARFTRHRYQLHTHPTYVVALITQGCERVRIGNETVLAPSGTVLLVDPEIWHDGEAGAD
ncbi:AraC family ligand binding domain-containing protein [Mesorhizobium sp. M0802]